MTNRERIQQALQFHQRGDLTSARELYEQLLVEDPKNAEALHLLGVIAIQSNQPSEAVRLIEQAVAIRSDQAAWFGNLGTARSTLGDDEGSIAAYGQALALKPNHVESHYNIAHAYRQAGNKSAAEQSYRTAIQLAPNHTGALNNLATCLRDDGRSDEAVEFLQNAVAAAPDFAQGWYNLANALRDVDRIEDAIHACERAMQLMPDFADIKASLGMLLLAAGDFERGLPLYEFREQASGGALPAECQPRWDGSPLDGKTIMLFAEQGLGDTIQFVRYAGLLKSRGATVYLRTQKPLTSILGSYQPIDGVFTEGDPLPPFDVAAPLLSLPNLCGVSDEYLAATPYLKADPALQEQWKQKLSDIDGFRIGIAWQGAPGHLSDVRRSITLSQFESIAQVDSVKLIALQKGFGIEQIDNVPFSVHRLPDDIDEKHGAFMDTAAVMKNLDLIITTDTSIAHVAGALGVRVWILLSQGADWRWLTERSDSPWYPTATLYRQTVFGDWTSVFDRVCSDLRGLISPSTQEASIRVEVSAGELLDKITILQIKNERISDESKLENIRRELRSLETTRDEAIPKSDALTQLVSQLREINETLWEIEDDIRECERGQNFGDKFVHLARQVYITNDQRSEVKRAINELLGSRLVEEKSYSDYSADGT